MLIKFCLVSFTQPFIDTVSSVDTIIKDNELGSPGIFWPLNPGIHHKVGRQISLPTDDALSKPIQTIDLRNVKGKVGSQLKHLYWQCCGQRLGNEKLTPFIFLFFLFCNKPLTVSYIFLQRHYPAANWWTWPFLRR